MTRSEPGSKDSQALGPGVEDLIGQLEEANHLLAEKNDKAKELAARQREALLSAMEEVGTLRDIVSGLEKRLSKMGRTIQVNTDNHSRREAKLLDTTNELKRKIQSLRQAHVKSLTESPTKEKRGDPLSPDGRSILRSLHLGKRKKERRIRQLEKELAALKPLYEEACDIRHKLGKTADEYAEYNRLFPGMIRDFPVMKKERDEAVANLDQVKSTAHTAKQFALTLVAVVLVMFAFIAVSPQQKKAKLDCLVTASFKGNKLLVTTMNLPQPEKLKRSDVYVIWSNTPHIKKTNFVVLNQKVVNIPGGSYRIVIFATRRDKGLPLPSVEIKHN